MYQQFFTNPVPLAYITAKRLSPSHILTDFITKGGHANLFLPLIRKSANSSAHSTIENPQIGSADRKSAHLHHSLDATD